MPLSIESRFVYPLLWNIQLSAEFNFNPITKRRNKSGLKSDHNPAVAAPSFIGFAALAQRGVRRGPIDLINATKPRNAVGMVGNITQSSEGSDLRNTGGNDGKAHFFGEERAALPDYRSGI